MISRKKPVCENVHLNTSTFSNWRQTLKQTTIWRVKFSTLVKPIQERKNKKISLRAISYTINNIYAMKCLFFGVHSLLWVMFFTLAKGPSVFNFSETWASIRQNCTTVFWTIFKDNAFSKTTSGVIYLGELKKVKYIGFTLYREIIVSDNLEINVTDNTSRL